MPTRRITRERKGWNLGDGLLPPSLTAWTRGHLALSLRGVSVRSKQTMKLKALFADDDAVSPVIGVILMVAITVILAAVIGTFVLGLGDQVGNNAPQASFSYDFTNSTGTSADTLEIAHNGGATVDGTQLSIKASGDIASDDAGANSGASLDWTTVGTSEVTAGDSVNVYNHHGGSNADLSDDTVRVIWTSSSGDSSAELAKWTGPNA